MNSLTINDKLTSYQLDLINGREPIIVSIVGIGEFKTFVKSYSELSENEYGYPPVTTILRFSELIPVVHKSRHKQGGSHARKASR